ncbi:hypothetical protein ACFQL7_19915 [Halocatena marina]|uniref:Uncharacterized protein n=1 Tax=Halocatena marina TaxID=2934937 RepID=A0ABD5YX38_9EURY
MIGKRMTVGLLAALLVVSAVGAGGFPASVLAAGSSDDNDSRATATAIDVGQTETGTIEQGDVDWHAVEVESGKSIFANLTLTTENEEDLEFELYNPDGERIGEGPADLMVLAIIPCEWSRVGLRWVVTSPSSPGPTTSGYNPSIMISMNQPIMS